MCSKHARAFSLPQAKLSLPAHLAELQRAQEEVISHKGDGAAWHVDTKRQRASRDNHLGRHARVWELERTWERGQLGGLLWQSRNAGEQLQRTSSQLRWLSWALPQPSYPQVARTEQNLNHLVREGGRRWRGRWGGGKRMNNTRHS